MRSLQTNRNDFKETKDAGAILLGMRTLPEWRNAVQKYNLKKGNGTMRFKKCKQLFEYQHLLLLRDI
jgi:hypothetical protein